MDQGPIRRAESKPVEIARLEKMDKKILELAAQYMKDGREDSGPDESKRTRKGTDDEG